MKVRHSLIVCIFLLGLVLAGQAIWSGQLLVALSLVLAGVYCSLAVFYGIGETISNSKFQAAAAVIGAIGLLGVYRYHHISDLPLSKARTEALSSFVYMEGHPYCEPMTLEVQKISAFGLKACAIQNSLDQMSAVEELAKGIYFGPSLSLADSVYSLTSEPQKDYCAFAFKATFAACPDAFQSMSATSKELILRQQK